MGHKQRFMCNNIAMTLYTTLRERCCVTIIIKHLKLPILYTIWCKIQDFRAHKRAQLRLTFF